MLTTGFSPKERLSRQVEVNHEFKPPLRDSVNLFISQYDSSVQYASFDQALKLILQLGLGAWLAKSDLESAFRMIPIDFQSIQHLGVIWQEKYLVDTFLLFGNSSSCAIFKTFANFLEWVVEDRTSWRLSHYLDDFFFCRLTAEQCLYQMNSFQHICKFINFPVSKDKMEGPAQKLTFLGLGLDTINMVVYISQDKIRDAVTKLDLMLSVKKTSV